MREVERPNREGDPVFIRDSERQKAEIAPACNDLLDRFHELFTKNDRVQITINSSCAQPWLRCDVSSSSFMAALGPLHSRYADVRTAPEWRC